MSHPNATLSTGALFPQDQHPLQPAMSSTNQSTPTDAATPLPSTQTTMGSTGSMPHDEKSKYHCGECSIYLIDMKAVFNHMANTHLKILSHHHSRTSLPAPSKISTSRSRSSNVTPVPGARMVGTTTASGASVSTMPWSGTPSRAHQSSSGRAGASTLPAPPESTEKASQRRRNVKEEKAKVASSKRRLGHYKCQSPHCKKTYKTLNGLKTHIAKGICIPAANTDCPATGYPAHAVDIQRPAPQYPECFGPHLSADAHAMASLQQYQQWQMPQVHAHEDMQNLQAQGTPWTPLRVQQQQHIAASHGWPYQPTPAVQALAPTFAAPVIPQQGGPVTDPWVCLARASASTTAQMAQLEMELLQRKTRGM